MYTEPTCGPILRQSVFDDVARTRTRMDILPNMHTLIWKGPLHLSVMFMHSSIKSFVIWLPDELQHGSPRPFFQDISARMPSLTNLNLRSYVPIHHIESNIVDLIEGLPKLQSITFPRWYLTTEITEALSRLQQLGVIEFQYLSEQGCGDPDDTYPYVPNLSEGAFPALWDYSVTASFDDVARFFNLQFAPTNLTTFYVDSELIETASSIHDVLAVLAENCQLLKYLALVSFRDSSSPGTGSSHTESDNPDDYIISFDNIKPILKLANLTSLEMLHHHPIAVTKQDIETLASAWPSLETFILNNEPVIFSESTLMLDDLLSFARHCPKLNHLGLFVDASSVESPLGLSTTAALVPFKSLRRLSMGISIIDDDHPVSLYLSHILPLGCVLDCGITWDEGMEPDRDVFREVQERCDQWTKVAKLLPVLVKLRIEERERTRAMERELDDLRMRTGVLRDNAALGVRLDISSCVMI